MPRLEIELQGHLLIAGGRSAGMGVNQAMVCRRTEHGDVPYIPATALRGAVRIQLEALLRGATQAATGPFPKDNLAEGDTFQARDVVARLFGYSGRASDPGGSQPGILRFSDALPTDPEQARTRLRVRAGVGIDRYTSSAANQRLFFREECSGSSAPLTFLAELTITGQAQPEDLLFLRNAVTTTHAIGSGKSSGGGAVSIRWIDKEHPVRNRVLGDSRTACRARLVCRLLEPAAFGDGGMIGNHLGTELYLRGSTLRGAIAWALLNANRCKADDDTFKALFLNEHNPVSFGDGLPVRSQTEEGRIRPATRRRPRHQQGVEIDILVDELARHRVNRHLEETNQPHYLRPQYGGYKQSTLPARETDDLVRRTRTRVALDRYTGTAAPQKLFSYEYIDPWFGTPDENNALVPVRFVSWIENLGPESAKLLARLQHTTLFVGSGRHTGQGQVQVELTFHGAARDAPKTGGFAQHLEQKVRELALGLNLTIAAEPAPLVLVARSAYLPNRPGDHPLGDWEDRYGTPSACYRNREKVGGYDQRPNQGGYFKPLYEAVGAGSVFVYQPRPGQDLLLSETVWTALRNGVGKETALGCGRFELFEEEKHDGNS